METLYTSIHETLVLNSLNFSEVELMETLENLFSASIKFAML